MVYGEVPERMCLRRRGRRYTHQRKHGKDAWYAHKPSFAAELLRQRAGIDFGFTSSGFFSREPLKKFRDSAPWRFWLSSRREDGRNAVALWPPQQRRSRTKAAGDGLRELFQGFPSVASRLAAKLRMFLR